MKAYYKRDERGTQVNFSVNMYTLFLCILERVDSMSVSLYDYNNIGDLSTNQCIRSYPYPPILTRITTARRIPIT